ncbi:MAG TPA: FAD-binding oxidoreductase [Anaerolineae bacterium]|nr:FAD-binding oxidoreductase [Anaerolineae bacterium]HQH37108.1 FAD-binding oxidoreductase [Anaerolineae bacterium]
MRRWNGWGDDSFIYPLPEGAFTFLEQAVGPGVVTPDATLADVLAQVPPSRLPAHPLIHTEAEARLRHARGHSLPDWIALKSGTIGVFPDGVAYPTTDEEVRELLRYARAAGVCLIPYGGGTSVVGQINPLPGDTPILTVDMSRMCRLRAFDAIGQLATFEAGVAGPDLEAHLRAHGCTLGHYPQSFEYSTLGGWIAARSSGQQSLGYGRIEKLFAGGRIETPLGTWHIPANVPASAAGPDLRECVLGSEGRLGLITTATVRVSPLPEREEFHAFFFSTFAEGLDAVREIMQAKLPLAMLRLSTAAETATTLALAGHAVLIGGLEHYLALRGADTEKCMLIMGVAGRERITKAAYQVARGIAGDHGSLYVGQTFGKTWHKNRFKSPYLRDALWEAGYAIDTLETATDWAHVPALIEAIEDALRPALLDQDEFVHVFTHLSHTYPYGSNVYTQYLFRRAPTPAETLERWQTLKTAASAAIVAQGATISHQHGVGVDHKPYLAAEKGEIGMTALRALVKSFDPDGMMNPGKML